jgi:hypothetical protein
MQIKISQRSKRAFTILESIIMLGLLTVFCLVVAGVYKKVLTKSDEAEDPAWLSKGGDESMKTVNPIPADAMLPGRMAEQPGLGGDRQSQEVIKPENVEQPE